MQHFRLTLTCGHLFETSCVSHHHGAAYKPEYVGQEMPSPPVRCCDGSHEVTAQQKIPKLTGMEAGTSASDAGWGDQVKSGAD